MNVQKGCRVENVVAMNWLNVIIISNTQTGFSSYLCLIFLSWSFFKFGLQILTVKSLILPLKLPIVVRPTSSCLPTSIFFTLTPLWVTWFRYIGVIIQPKTMRVIFFFQWKTIARIGPRARRSVKTTGRAVSASVPSTTSSVQTGRYARLRETHLCSCMSRARRSWD